MPSPDNEGIQAQVATDGSRWTNLGAAVSRHNRRTPRADPRRPERLPGAVERLLDLLRISAYGDDVHLGDVSTTAQ
jgi:hypothetical protein